MLGYFLGVPCLELPNRLPRIVPSFCKCGNYSVVQAKQNLIRGEIFEHTSLLWYNQLILMEALQVKHALTLRVKCGAPTGREMEIHFWGRWEAGLVIQGMRKWRFHLVGTSFFRCIGQWRWNRIKQGRGAGKFLPLFHEWPHLTLLPAADTSFPLKLHVVLNKWVSSESLSRTNQHTSLVSKWRVHSTVEAGDYFLIPHQR